MSKAWEVLFILILAFSQYTDISDQVENTQAIQKTSTSYSNSLEIAYQSAQSSFYENVGQASNHEVKYYASLTEITIGFCDSGLVILGNDTSNECYFPELQNSSLRAKDLVSNTATYILGRQDIFTGVRSYRSLVYENVWCGIDLHFGFFRDEVIFSFHIDENVDLLQTSIDRITHIYDALSSVTGIREFTAHNIHNVLSITSQESSIQPSNNPFVFSTFLGGTDDDSVADVAVDQFNQIYITGYTRSPQFPSTESLDSSHNGGADCFVMKLNSTGTGIVYSTFIGGSSTDFGESIKVDMAGNVYIGGRTVSPDFPVKNAYDSTYDYGDEVDGFLLKLNSTGTGLEYSTFIGGTSFDWIEEIDIDLSSNVVAVGITFSSDFPTVNATINSNSIGDKSGFALKLNATGNGLVYSTYIGGSNSDEIRAVFVDAKSDAYMTGLTSSTDFPIVAAFNASLNGVSDSFVVKLNSSGGIQHSTYFGGTGADVTDSIWVGVDGNVYIGGGTESQDFPLVDPVDSIFEGQREAFFAALDFSEVNVTFSSFLGGYGSDHIHSLTLDSEGNIIVIGQTDSTDFPIISSYNKSFIGNTSDVFISKLDIQDSQILFSTFLGGSGSDIASAITVSPSGDICVVGRTASPDYPTFRALDESLEGDTYDGFVMKIHDLTDNDMDRIPDWWEFLFGLNLTLDDSSLDPDEDVLVNLDEFIIGTDPTNNDTDSDNTPDGWEVSTGLEPLTDDSQDDPDVDGLTNLEEFLHSTHPNSNDTDHDNMMDGWEIVMGLDALLDDASDDPDSDGLSNLDEFTIGTHPLDRDSDGDNMPDGWEMANGLDPLSTDSENDPDADGLTNLEEFRNDTDPNNPDTDGDEIPDGWEVEFGFSPHDPFVSLLELLVLYRISLIVSALFVVASTSSLVFFIQWNKRKIMLMEKAREEEIRSVLDDLSSLEQNENE